MRVLFVQHAANYSGSTISGELVVSGFRKAGWDVETVFGYEGPFLERYAALGSKVHVIPHKNWLRGGNFFQSLRRISQECGKARHFRHILQDFRPDVTYVNTLVSLSAALASRRSRVPCIWHIRELFDDEAGGEMRIPACGGRSVVRLALRRLATRRIAISLAVARNILGTASERLVDVIPNAVPESFFDLQQDRESCRRFLGLPLERPVIGVPGTLRPVKGHEFFLRAAAEVIRSVPECYFAITGGGEPGFQQRLEEKAASLGLSERVRFLGTISGMPQFYRACDAVCIPSLSEPFGRTVIEAFALGAPVVATAVGGMVETVSHEDTGLLVPYGDTGALTAALVRVLQDADLRMRFEQSGSEAARRLYTEQAYQQRINAIVSEVANPRGPRQA